MGTLLWVVWGAQVILGVFLSEGQKQEREPARDIAV